MTNPVAPPAAPTVPVYPALGSPSFNQEAYAYGSAMPGVSAALSAIGEAAYTNAVAADERAVNAGISKAAAEAARDAAQAAASTATTKAADAVAARDDAVPAAVAAMAARDEAVPAATAAIAARDAAEDWRDQAEVFATQQIKATSTTSLTPGAGNKTFTIETSRSFVAGMYLVATSAGAPEDKMSGYVVSYNGATGQLIVAVDAFAGSTARADWVIGVAAPGSAGGLATQVVTANTACIANVSYIVAAAGITLTLPASWGPGDKFAVIEAIGDNKAYSLDFGATKLRGRSVGAVLITASRGSTGELRYQDSTQGLV